MADYQVQPSPAILVFLLSVETWDSIRTPDDVPILPSRMRRKFCDFVIANDVASPLPERGAPGIRTRDG
jgi:hypothetical protein